MSYKNFIKYFSQIQKLVWNNETSISSGMISNCFFRRTVVLAINNILLVHTLKVVALHVKSNTFTWLQDFPGYFFSSSMKKWCWNTALKLFDIIDGLNFSAVLQFQSHFFSFILVVLLLFYNTVFTVSLIFLVISFKTIFEVKIASKNIK